MSSTTTIVRRGLSAAALMLAGFVLVPISSAHAGNVAARCGEYGCEYIRCNYTGDHCYHVSGNYGGYGGRYYGAGYETGYRDDDVGYGYGYGHLVCDSDGDRCYRGSEPYWNYREYYRRHGYRWVHSSYRYGESGYSDRLNRDEYEHHRYDYGRDDDYRSP